MKQKVKTKGKAATHGKGKRQAMGQDAAKSVMSLTLLDAVRMPVRTIMRTDVVTLRPDDTIKSAAEQLEEGRVTGAPVVDGAGKVLGVFTLRDLARSDHVSDEGVDAGRPVGAAPSFDETAEELGVDEGVFATDEYRDELLGRVRVADWMTPGVIQVEPDTTLASACRRMLDESIHRVFVVERERLLGVVSTEDIVGLLAESPERSEPPAGSKTARRAPKRRSG